MKRVVRITICIAGGLALNAGLRAADPASANNPLPDNPYAAVAVRNIFGLVAPPPPPDPNAKQEASLPKITPTGIMTVFGHSQVLFKVAGTAVKQGQPARDEFYILSQGQRQDDIEVTKIDEKNSLVTFNNHDITQELPLVSPPASGSPAASPSPVAGNPAMGQVLPGGGNNGPGGITRFGVGPGGRNGSMGNGANSSSGGGGNGGNGGNGGLPLGGATQGRTYQPEASTMSPEASTILIEAQRAALMNSPTPEYSPALLPTTPLTKFNTPDGETPAP